MTNFQVKAVLEEILEKIPETFNMAEIMAKAAEKTPYVVVAFQECERMNILTNEMRRSLKELNLGLKVRRKGPLGPGTRLQRPAGATSHLGCRTRGPSLVPSCGPATPGQGGTHRAPSQTAFFRGPVAQAGRAGETRCVTGQVCVPTSALCPLGGTDHHE